jgi:DNA-binding NtrC family response regulator
MTEPKPNNSEPRHDSEALIYVVDDEPMLLELATVILTPLRYRIQTFRDPRDALKSFLSAGRRPALIITDYAMHQMNGLALLEECRQIDPGQRVLLVSGTVDASIYANSACKPDRFLAKPYLPQQLIRLVNELIGH